MPTEAPAASLYDFFGPRGRLAEIYEGYEYRRGQLRMAETIAAALDERRHLLVEAGTGTGKTLAYLAPILRSGRRVLISTGTRNLQEQLVFKDIPILERALGRELRAVCMKGRGNYACRWKIHELSQQAGFEFNEIEPFNRIRAWSETSAWGDRAELDFLPEPSRLWDRLNARRETCTGSKCSLFDACFLTRLRQQACQADLVIVNHHLFFADLTLKDRNLPGVLPPYEAVVFDEAHELETVAGQYFGLSLSNFQIEDLARDMERTPAVREITGADWDGALGRLRQGAAGLLNALGEHEGRFSFEQRPEFLAQHAADYHGARQALQGLAGRLEAVPGRAEELALLAQRARDLEFRLEFLFASEDANMVFWHERRGRGVYLQATPIAVAEHLRETLFSVCDTVILTSATLAIERNFAYIRDRLGLEAAREEVVDSPFDPGRQALLYLPPEMPDPRQPEFLAEALTEIEQLLLASRGRAFVLSTSYEQMRKFHERLRPRLPFPTLAQGEAPRHHLLEQFRATPHAVLFATSSFWQGVDVQGEQLSCVIIDRLPFASPGEPVVKARIEALRREGRNPFREYQIPEAILALKQGTGRLLRSGSDRGVVAVLDARIRTQSYGRLFLESLPAYRVCQRLDEVRKFFTPAGSE